MCLYFEPCLSYPYAKPALSIPSTAPLVKKPPAVKAVQHNRCQRKGELWRYLLSRIGNGRVGQQSDSVGGGSKNRTNRFTVSAKTQPNPVHSCHRFVRFRFRRIVGCSGWVGTVWTLLIDAKKSEQKEKKSQHFHLFHK